MPLADPPPMVADVGGLRTIVLDLPEVVAGAVMERPVVAHVWGASRPSSDEVVAQTAGWSVERGWRAVVVVVDDAAWDRAVHRVADRGVRVVRAPLRRNQHRVRSVRRRTAGFARWLSLEHVAIVHAHDDTAAAIWRGAVRRARVPMVWDVDLGARPRRTDGMCVAAASYLLTSGTGDRLCAPRQPPRRTIDGGPGHVADVVDDVYRCLTGINALADQTVGDPPANVRIGV